MTHDDREPRNLFDVELGEQKRDDAIEQVARNANTEWMAAAIRAVEACAHRYNYFSTDHVWQTLETFGCPRPAGLQPKAIGEAMRNVARRGLIVATNTSEKSRRPEAHRRPITVWRSIERTTP